MRSCRSRSASSSPWSGAGATGAPPPRRGGGGGFVAPGAGAGADLSPESQALLSVIGSGLSGVITTAITAPFTAAVATLQYVDLRIRREGFDVELMAAASSR